MNSNKNTFITSFLITIALAVAFVFGFLTRSYLPSSLPAFLPTLVLGQSNPDFRLLHQSYSILESEGINPLPAEPALEYGMIRGMIQAYGDPFTSFLEPPQAQLQNDSLHGSYGGIGVRLGKDPQGYFVLYPYPDGPAAKAGVKDGDRLLAVGEKTINGDTPTDVLQTAVRGVAGETVILTVASAPDYTPRKVSITRAEIPLPSVTWHIDPSQPRLGVFEVNIIAESTPQEIQKAFKDLQSRGATHFIMDLRDNGGGLLNSGIEIARLFLKDGDIIQQQYRGRPVETYHVDKPGALSDIPLAVLINGNTASASEIIAGALQAHTQAELVGTPSFGKNTIQLVFTLDDGSSLHVTAAHWWIPGLKFPKGIHDGLQPDVRLPDNVTDPNVAVQEAIRVLFK